MNVAPPRSFFAFFAIRKEKLSKTTFENTKGREEGDYVVIDEHSGHETLLAKTCHITIATPT